MTLVRMKQDGGICPHFAQYAGEIGTVSDVWQAARYTPRGQFYFSVTFANGKTLHNIYSNEVDLISGEFTEEERTAVHSPFSHAQQARINRASTGEMKRANRRGSSYY